MSLKDNFNIDSWRLFPYWICVFTSPAAIALVVIAIIGYELTPELFTISNIVSALCVYLIMKRYPVFSYKAIIVIAVLFTAGVAFEFAKVAYLASGIVPALIVPIPIFLLSYLVNRYALKPKPNSPIRPAVFFFF